MLTRYLYDCDEVCYALIDSLYRGRSEEAVFWARELLLSKEDIVLEKTVVRAWLLFLGAPNIHWLDAWFNGLDKLTLISEFSTLMKRGRSVASLKTFVIAGRGLSPEQNMDRVNAAINENDPFSFYWWVGAAYKKTPSALMKFIKEFVEDPVLFGSLEKALALFPGIPMKMLICISAVQLLCLKSYPPDYVLGSLVEMPVLEDSMKANRVYPILANMLSQKHKRVEQSDALCKTQKEIIGCAGSKFWNEVNEKIVDDDSLEELTEELFPDDTPDEWSVQERNKSHPVEFISYKRFIKTSYRAKLLWGFAPALKKEWSVRIDSIFKFCLAPEY